jgi:hypothetical protein
VSYESVSTWMEGIEAISAFDLGYALSASKPVNF